MRPYIQNKKLGNLRKSWTELRETLKVYMFKNKKENFWGFWVFDCCPVTKIENWEISEIFLPQILTVVVT